MNDESGIYRLPYALRHSCVDCMHSACGVYDYPCVRCSKGNKWEPKKGEDMKKEEKHQYTLEELKEIWTEFEKEWHMSPGYHLCAEDVTRFLDFLDKWEDRKNRKHGIAVKSVRSFWEV